MGSGGALNLGYIRDNLTLNMQLSALENDDKIKIVSNPRVIGLDNQEAKIKQGVALPYLTLNDNGVTSTEFKDAVLELEVTPKITPSNTISLAVKVTKNQKSAQTGAGNGRVLTFVKLIHICLLKAVSQRLSAVFMKPRKR